VLAENVEQGDRDRHIADDDDAPRSERMDPVRREKAEDQGGRDRVAECVRGFAQPRVGLLAPARAPLEHRENHCEQQDEHSVDDHGRRMRLRVGTDLLQGPPQWKPPFLFGDRVPGPPQPGGISSEHVLGVAVHGEVQLFDHADECFRDLLGLLDRLVQRVTPRADGLELLAPIVELRVELVDRVPVPAAEDVRLLAKDPKAVDGGVALECLRDLRLQSAARLDQRLHALDDAADLRFTLEARADGCEPRAELLRAVRHVGEGRGGRLGRDGRLGRGGLRRLLLSGRDARRQQERKEHQREEPFCRHGGRQVSPRQHRSSTRGGARV
jgi:hypothetical protein